MEFQIDENRIYLIEGGKLLAEVTFPYVYSKTVNINHTFVDDSLRGQGIADKLLQAAVQQIQKNNWTVIPTCSYALSWFAKHPEYNQLIYSQ